MSSNYFKAVDRSAQDGEITQFIQHGNGVFLCVKVGFDRIDILAALSQIWEQGSALDSVRRMSIS